MAANSTSRGITAVGKRVANRIWTSNSPSSPPLTLRRAAAAYSSSVYDKNPDDLIHHAETVPDDVIQSATTPSGKYWAPHPQTGVFGPPNDQGTKGEVGAVAAGSVLEEKAWFRPTSLEDLEKPPHHL